MPGFDGTGPQGCGPLTGRGMGNCRQMNNCSRGFGSGRGRFCRFMDPVASITPQEQLDILKENKKKIEAEIENLEKVLK